jgi:6-phosphofructokinase 1
MKKINNISMEVEKLGKSKIPNPVKLSNIIDDFMPNYVHEDRIILYKSKFNGEKIDPEESFEAGGPRENIYFDPCKTRVGIVTCGGLCPGLNNVIKSIVTELVNSYGVHSVYGFKYGYSGFAPSHNYPVVELTPEVVKDWDLKGGSMLGSSRGPQTPEVIIDTCERMNLNILFTLGGDGTLRGADAINKEAQTRGYKMSVIGIPKTIDNDIAFVSKTFGFETAVAKATEAIRAAFVEAEGAPRGVGMVKLMGRHSGYIAAHAALAAGNVDCVLIPEAPFKLDKFFDYIKEKIEKSGKAVIVVAEGAGQDLFANEKGDKDASGNKKLQDIGVFLGKKLKEHFKSINEPVNLKYIDPSYIIRATSASPTDAIFCRRLGENGVHAAMIGATGIVVGLWNGYFTHLPLEAAVSKRKQIDTDGDLWSSIIQMTCQPVKLF